MPVDRRPSTVLIIGASRGLGLGLAREYLRRGRDVVATVRGATVRGDTGHGDRRTGLHELADTAGGRLTIEQLEITDADQLRTLRQRLAGRTFETLFVNAGIMNDRQETIGEVATEVFVQVMITNALSPLRVVETLQDLVPRGGTIAVMSSGLGSVADNDSGGFDVYRASKAALNTLMRCFAARHRNDSRSFAVVAPGWVRTDMGGEAAPLDVDTSVAGIVDALDAQSGHPGLRYLDYRGNTVRW